MRVIVTGGAGFIGSHSVERLLSVGHLVLVVDDLSAGSLDYLHGVRSDYAFEQADIRNRARLQRVFAAWRPDAVLHLAAIASVPRSVDEPLLTASVNLLGSLEVLEAARLAGARRVVAASSAAVYGPWPHLPSRETDATDPVSPYAAQKLALEEHLRVYQRAYGLETTAVRYFNVYGPRQSAASPYSGVISLVVDRLRRDEVFDVQGDGEQTRDFISVLDIAEINRRLLESHDLDGLPTNAGSGESTSLLALIQSTAALLGQAPRLSFGPPRAGDVRQSRADITRLRGQLGDLQLRPLSDGLRAILDDPNPAPSLQ